ncbi:hypothetical protein [Nocardia sp. NPDC056000]|uniref:hypothetical protein n=1 Tax=Nocardia sp. NPDC056000 TaxID=3345674 RepID=UPI0035D86989
MGSGIFEDRARAEQAAAESLVWEWFSAAVAWTLFTLPAESFLVLSARDEVSAGFFRGSGHLHGELADGQEAVLPWPARFSDYERIAAQAVAAMRDVHELWLPMELTARAWTDGLGADPDLNLLGLGRHSVENLRALATVSLADFAARNRRTLESAMRVVQRDHRIRVQLARDFVASRNIEIIGGGDAALPGRDRTADCIGLVGPDHLLMVDVLLGVRNTDDLRLDSRVIGESRAERGTDSFARAMVRADPNLRATLETRPDLAAVLERDEVWIEYQFIVPDAAQRHTRIGCKTVDRRRPGAVPGLFSRHHRAR